MCIFQGPALVGVSISKFREAHKPYDLPVMNEGNRN